MINVIIPLYKGREVLPQALDSLVAQTKKQFIVTIVQDGDGENYDDIIEEYMRRGLHIRHLELINNSGAGVARQTGMDYDSKTNAPSEYFVFLDADDMLLPSAIDTLYKEMRASDADIVISSFYREDGGRNTLLLSTETSITWMHGKMYRAKFLQENNIRFDPDIRLNEDSYFNLLAVNCADKVARIEEVTYIWRDNKNSVTATIMMREISLPAPMLNTLKRKYAV